LSRWSKRTFLASVAVLLSLALIAGCGGTGQPGAGSPIDAKKKPIKLADVQWQSLWINNAIARFIIEKGYGYPVETVEMTTPIMQQALVKGDVDVTTELWPANIMDWYTDATKTGKISDLGVNMERAQQGWYVPRYMIEGDAKRNIKATAPDLKKVQDLKKYKGLFKDPEDPNKGVLISCITGWNCAVVNRVKLQAYGLADDYNVIEPGASAALDAAIAGAYKKGVPFLAYYWEPTWLVGTYDMVMLEEPPFSKECEAQATKVMDKKMPLSQVTAVGGCAFEKEVVKKVANPSLKSRAPEVVEFLTKMQVGTDPMNKTAAYMEANKIEADKAAIYYFENNQDRWRTWLPPDVLTKVEAALKAAGAKL
jgi:glycine betaine/proline transport system substrate-binding protein